MTESNESLEAELAALQPHQASPALRRRVGDRLTGLPHSRSRRVWGIAVAGGLAAACVTAAIFLWRGNGRPEQIEQAVIPPKPVLPVEEMTPTLQAYSRALARSPEELDALLDKHAAAAPRLHRESSPVHAFTRSQVDLQTWRGEF
jgi:hypothetical protein